VSQIAAYLLTALAGLVAGWAITMPLHRYKELRPLTPRDVAAEVGNAQHPPTTIRAAYRQARCVGCRRVSTGRDVVPVLSWARGCLTCGTRPPATVPITQMAVPLAMLVTVGTLGDPWVALPYLWLVVVLCAVAIIDLRIWLIPWWMPWIGAAIGFALIAAVSVALGSPRHILFALAGGVGAFLLFFVLWLAAPGKLGFGDVRLALLLGMFLAWIHPVLPVYGLLFGSTIGLFTGVVALLSRRGSRFPFGPALAVGAMTAVWFHEPILRGLTG
jgi:prepilin signal peptidase PulO-like enzyme (type II secretory pathway)